MKVKYPLYLIRRYHSLLLHSANAGVRMRKSLQDSDYMPFLWQHEVAQLIAKERAAAKEIAQTIRTLRKDYGCVDY